MTGLIQKNLLVGYVSVSMTIFIISAAAVAGFIIRVPGAHSIATFAIAGAFTTNFMAHFHRKDDANWQLLETTMPMKLASVELSRYLSFLVVFALIIVAAAVYTLTNYLSGVLNYPYAVGSTFVHSLTHVTGMYFILPAIQFPALRFFSAKNSIAIAYGSFVAAFGIFFAAMWIGGRLPEELQDIGYWPFAAVSLTLFVLSYFISVRIYRRRCSI